MILESRLAARAAGAAVALWAAFGLLAIGPATAQQPADGAKKELVARVLKLQQSGLEQLGRALAEAPAQQMVAQARAALQRAPADKRDAVARELDAEVRKYLDETVPLVRDRATARWRWRRRQWARCSSSASPRTSCARSSRSWSPR